jgi:hypothetical protein
MPGAAIGGAAGGIGWSGSGSVIGRVEALNIQNSTFNIERGMARRARFHSALNVECWALNVSGIADPEESAGRVYF